MYGETAAFPQNNFAWTLHSCDIEIQEINADGLLQLESFHSEV